ncbi:MAG: tyrosine-type recombinase/integrase, partial [Actinobacteria bacterium]|nr:tyrosine-type recombinase/integrase [Actinomycetota bacterium]
ITLAMVLGGLRASEIRGLLLADVDQGRRQLRVVGKGGRERVVPVDRAFFSELAAYLHRERPPGLATPECFVVLRGPTAGQPLTEAGLRSVFRYHRATSGALTKSSRGRVPDVSGYKRWRTSGKPSCDRVTAT